MTTDRTLYVYDARGRWLAPALGTALVRGWRPRRVETVADVDGPGYLLAFVHAHPELRLRGQALVWELVARGDLVPVTDPDQVEVYDDKRAQCRRWGRWMPRTSVIEADGEVLDDGRAVELAVEVGRLLGYPLVSKADVGASSYNVRVIKDERTLRGHAQEVFGPGVPVEYNDSLGTRGVQRGYLLLQEHVPHEVTYRVNVVGNQRALFYRYNHPDRPVAQTGNVRPMRRMDPLAEELFAWVEEVRLDLGTRWCALDALRDEARGEWRLLETSLRWPWPSPGDCDKGWFFVPDGTGGWRRTRQWWALWEVLMDELEAGTWDDGLGD